jgi:glyoxylate carboligase
MAAQRKALEAECADARESLEAELAGLRTDAQRAREQLLADAKEMADRDREEARRAVAEAGRQRVRILEQLMDVYRDLDAVPAALESAYRELDDKVSAG